MLLGQVSSASNSDAAWRFNFMVGRLVSCVTWTLFGQVSCAGFLYSVLDTLGGHVFCCWSIGVSIALGFSCSSHACM